MRYFFLLLPLFVFNSCTSPATSTQEEFDLVAALAALEGLPGRSEYLNSPYVTAGDRLYMVGHQDGTFPDHGWHVAGEMGGIWDHPIKLMDGLTASVEENGALTCLEAAESFTNYPIGNVHTYSLSDQLTIQRAQFVPDGKEGLVVQYKLINEKQEDRKLRFTFNAMVDLQPVWLGERSGMIDSLDDLRYQADEGVIVGKDAGNEWYVVCGADRLPSTNSIADATCDFERAGKGSTGNLGYDVELAAGQTTLLTFVISGSYTAQDAAMASWSTVLEGYPGFFADKRSRYQDLVTTARITIPDPTLQRALEWTRYNTDWLIRDVPEEGRGMAAGMADYPWWFGCDATYALQGVLASGRTDIAYSTLRLLKELSEETNGNGRVIHEASTNGVVFNPGNINETPHFASMIWCMYEWTGDRPFLEEFYPFVNQGLKWLLEETDEDGNYLPDGFGMMEIHGLDSEMIDVAVYTQQGMDAAAKMARTLGETDAAVEYERIAAQLLEIINTDFWVDEFASYADFIGTPEQALHLIEDAIVRADTLGKPWAVEELEATRAKVQAYPAGEKRGFVLHHNWVVNTPMEVGIAEPEKALTALETGSQFVNPFGMFVTGIDRDESAGTDDSSFAEDMEIFSYVGAVMTLPTGVQAIAENNYGRPDEALGYLQRLTKSFNYALPGSMYEVSPDFGMMTQAWTIYSLTVPVVQQFFGVQPVAYDQRLSLQPRMPSSWNEASLLELPVANNVVSVSFQRIAEGERWRFTQQSDDWSTELRFPAGAFSSWTVNGEAVEPENKGNFDVLVLDGLTEMELELKK